MTPRHHAPRRARPPRGFTLVELIVATALAGIVAAAAGAVLRQQAQSFAALATRGRTDAEARATLELAGILRWAAPADLLAVDSASIDLRAFVGATIACRAPADGVVDLAGLDADIASWLWAPRPGDHLELDDDSTPRTVTAVTAVTAVTTTSTSCLGSTPAAAFRVTFQPARATPTPSAAHLLRTTRLILYRASDRRWFLGASERDDAAWSTVQPAAGPLAAPADSGLRFELLDSLGDRTADPGAARAVRIVATAVADVDAPTTIRSNRGAIVSLRNGRRP